MSGNNQGPCLHGHQQARWLVTESELEFISALFFQVT